MPLLTRLDLRGHRGDGESLAAALPRPRSGDPDVSQAVAEIVEQVRTGGDEALLALTERLDGVQLPALRVAPAEVAAAAERIPEELRRSLEVAHRRIAAYHAFEAGIPWPPEGRDPSGGRPVTDGAASRVLRDADGVTVQLLVRPVRRAGCYAPGGRARYPSTVLMCAAPARVAGVGRVALCVPPGPDGQVDDATLAAAAIAGVDDVHPVGGAQAMAAMAFGTETIEPVDVVVGPGNRYVAEAKRQLAGIVGVASAFAGPSEVVVVAGPGTAAELAAVDLVVQAEHGPDGAAWLVTWDEDVLESVTREVEAMVAASPRRSDLEATMSTGGYACLVAGAEEAIEVANLIAPEHLELMVDDAEALLPLVEAAGAVFCGPWSPASVGDYVAGPNHVLPTDRTARFGSALRADDFRRHLHAVSLDRRALAALGPHVAVLAAAEGLPAHADSVRRRLVAP